MHERAENRKRPSRMSYLCKCKQEARHPPTPNIIHIIKHNVNTMFKFLKEKRHVISKVLKWIGGIITLTVSTFFIQSCIS